MCHVFFIHSSVQGHLRFFHALATVNSTSVNTRGTCVFCKTASRKLAVSHRRLSSVPCSEWPEEVGRGQGWGQAQESRDVCT